MDIKCAVCGEPWDQYGVAHGDIAPWQAVLFRKGSGCPCCCGKSTKQDHLVDHLQSVVFNSESPDDFDRLHDPEGKPPEWKRPDDIVRFECAGCGAKYMVNVDHEDKPENYDITRYWIPGKRWDSNHRTGLDDTTDEDAVTIGDGKYCCQCAGSCYECGTSIFNNSDLYSSCYDPGASFPHPDNARKTVCVDCFEALPSNFEALPTGDEEEEE